MTGAERSALALLVWCGFCWAAPGTACAGGGQHFARCLRAYRRGLISRADMAVVCQAVPQVSPGQVITDLTTPGAAACQGAMIHM